MCTPSDPALGRDRSRPVSLVTIPKASRMAIHVKNLCISASLEEPSGSLVDADCMNIATLCVYPGFSD
jgi:hypothetical protein